MFLDFLRFLNYVLPVLVDLRAPSLQGVKTPIDGGAELRQV